MVVLMMVEAMKVVIEEVMVVVVIVVMKVVMKVVTKVVMKVVMMVMEVQSSRSRGGERCYACHVHKVLRLPRNLHSEVRTKSTLSGSQSAVPAAKSALQGPQSAAQFQVHTKRCACHEISTSRSAKYCTCHEIYTARFPSRSPAKAIRSKSTFKTKSRCQNAAFA